jgi:hypothetical protein
MPSKKTKTVIGASVGGVLGAVAIGLGVYFATRKVNSGGVSSNWTCVDDGQGSTMLLNRGTPCARFSSLSQCQSAANSNTVSCTCPSGQVLKDSTCVPVCVDSSATWNSSQQKCVCPTGRPFNYTTLQCSSACSPPLTVNSSTGAVTGFYNNNGVCVDSTQVSAQTEPPQALLPLNAVCEQTLCQVPSVCSTGGMYFVGYDPSKHACVANNACDSKPYLYSWPDGSTFCPGLVYSGGSSTGSSTGTSCVTPDTSVLEQACKTTTGGCPQGTQPLQGGEQCSTSGINAKNACRTINATPTCPANSNVNATQCPESAGKGVCYNSTSQTCVPATYPCVSTAVACPSNSTLSSTCASSPVGPCLNSQNQCVKSLVGCRPSSENWLYNSGVCAVDISTALGKLALTVDANSTIQTITVSATAPTTYTGALTSLQFRYLLVVQSTTTVPPPHWAGVVTNATLSTTNTNTVQLTITPDQSISAVPAGTTLKLVVMGLSQNVNGSWVVALTSPGLSDASVTTCSLKASTPSCLPTIGFDVNKALSMVPQLQSLPQTVAVTQAATLLGLAGASTAALNVSKTGAFAGAVVPSTVSSTQLFVLLAWNITTTPNAVTYVVTKNGTTVYTGTSTALVDAVDKSTVYNTYSIALHDSTCTAQPVVTTLPPLC